MQLKGYFPPCPLVALHCKPPAALPPGGRVSGVALDIINLHRRTPGKEEGGKKIISEVYECVLGLWV